MYRASLALALVTVACSASAQKPEPKPKSDLELLQGSWRIVGQENGGKTQPDKAFRGNTFAFGKLKGTNIVTLQEWKYAPLEFTYSLDPATKPKALDLTIKGSTVRGIYKLEGDELTICMSLVGPRPTEFSTKAGGDTELFHLKRDRWERYSDKTFGFTIEFPGKPIEAKKESETTAGKITTTSLAVRSEMDHLLYTMFIMPLPEPVDPKDAEATLDLAQQLIVAEIDARANAKLEAEGKPFELPRGVAGVLATREFTVVLTPADSKDRAAMRVRLFLAGNRVYALAVTGSDGATRSPSVGEFWNSLRIPPGKKKDPPSK